jgi:hypothetical protein
MGYSKIPCPSTFLHLFLIVILLNISYLYSTKNYGYEFFQIVTKNHREYLVKHNSTDAAVSGSVFLPHLHLMRVPKASSSSLSTVARRVVGCEPPGPCCKWPGDPIGSCPNKRLFDCEIERKVVGCTGHNPHYSSLQSSKLASITIIREPIARSISGFFYPNHHNMECFSSFFPFFSFLFFSACFGLLDPVYYTDRISMEVSFGSRIVKRSYCNEFCQITFSFFVA